MAYAVYALRGRGLGCGLCLCGSSIFELNDTRRGAAILLCDKRRHCKDFHARMPVKSLQEF